MPNANHNKGARLELTVKKWLENKGMIATRSAGSKVEFDVTGISPRVDFLAQNLIVSFTPSTLQQLTQ